MSSSFPPGSQAASAAVQAMLEAGCPNTSAGLQLIHSVQDLLNGDADVARTISNTLWLKVPVALSQTSINRAVPGLRFVLSRYPQYASRLISSLLTSSTYQLGRALPVHEQRLAMSRTDALREDRGTYHRWWFANQSNHLTSDDIERLFSDHPSAQSLTFHPQFPWSMFDSTVAGRALHDASFYPDTGCPFIETDVANRLLREIDSTVLRDRLSSLIASSPLLESNTAEALLGQAKRERNHRAVAALLSNPRMSARTVNREWALNGTVDALGVRQQIGAAGHPELARGIRGPFIRQGGQGFYSTWEVARVMRHDDVLDAVNPDDFFALAETANQKDMALFLAMAEAERLSPVHWEALAMGSTAAKVFFARQTGGKVQLPATRRIEDSVSAMLRIETPIPNLDASSTWDDLPGANFLPFVIPLAIERRAQVHFGDVTVSAIRTTAELDSIGFARWPWTGEPRQSPSVVVKAVRGSDVYTAVIDLRESQFVVKRTGGMATNSRDLPQWATNAFENAARIWTSEQVNVLGLA